MTCGSTSSARPGRAARASIPPTQLSGSRTCPPASSCPARTRRASCRTKRRRCGSCVPGCWRRPRWKPMRRPRPSAAARSRRWIDRSGSGPTTTRKTGSPTTGSVSRHTTSTRCSTETWTRSSPPWSMPTGRTRWPRHGDLLRQHSMSLLMTEIAVAVTRLAEAGVESPRADAELMAAHRHGVARGALNLVADADFDPRFWDDVARREAREPLQHIIGTACFRYVELEVGPGVFVPRPETEVMTGWAIDRLTAMDVAEPVGADLGTGSGAIALAIAQEVPRARVHAVEGDPLARPWTERNIEHCAAAAPHTRGRVRLHGDDFA